MSAAKICPVCGKAFDLSDRFCPTDGAVLRSPEATGDLVGEIIAERYHVLSKLGEGGMGQVYLAEHIRMGRKSAVKVMSPALSRDADAISRFNREASNASRISHPNVASIYDFGETPEGLIYLAMEFVEGEPLTQLIERQGALLPARAAAVIRQTGDALAAAHELGIVHRDLKPDNIMVARGRDGSDVVKVVDFGIAKAAGAESQKVTRTGLVVGTPEYMSPEQLAGDPLDARSDVYSLGLVAFTMLTGALPFPSETAQESMIMRLTERPRSLAEMRPGTSWPAPVQQVMDRALQRDLRARCASAAEFGRDLERALLAMGDAGILEAGTQPIAVATLPKTRVAQGDAATVVVPASAAASPDAPARSRAGPALTLVAALLTLVTAGVSLANKRDAPEAATLALAGAADSSASGAGNPARLAEGAPLTVSASTPPDDSAAPGDTVLLRQPVAIPAAGSAPASTATLDGDAAERRDAILRARTQLGSAREVVEGSLQADAIDRPVLLRAITGLTQALTVLPTAADSIEARYLRAQSHGLLGDADRSCQELDALVALDLPRRLRTEIGTLRATACQ